MAVPPSIRPMRLKLISGTAVVDLHGSVDFNGAAGQAADVTDIFQIVRENYGREGAGNGVFAQIQEMDPFVANFHADDLAYHTFYFADVLAGPHGWGCSRRRKPKRKATEC